MVTDRRTDRCTDRRTKLVDKLLSRLKKYEVINPSLPALVGRVLVLALSEYHGQARVNIIFFPKSNIFIRSFGVQS